MVAAKRSGVGAYRPVEIVDPIKGQVRLEINKGTGCRINQQMQIVIVN